MAFKCLYDVFTLDRILGLLCILGCKFRASPTLNGAVFSEQLPACQMSVGSGNSFCIVMWHNRLLVHATIDCLYTVLQEVCLCIEAACEGWWYVDDDTITAWAGIPAEKEDASNIAQPGSSTGVSQLQSLQVAQDQLSKPAKHEVETDAQPGIDLAHAKQAFAQYLTGVHGYSDLQEQL